MKELKQKYKDRFLKGSEEKEDKEEKNEDEDVEVGDRPHEKIHEMSVLGQNAYNRSQHHKKIMLQGTGKNKQGSVQDK